MMDPAKFLNFIDIAGTWDPSLTFYMAGAMTMTFFGYRFVLQRSKPLFSDHFQIPPSAVIYRRLVSGSALPGFIRAAILDPGAAGQWEVILFLASAVAGFALRRVLAPTPEAVVS